MRRSASSVRRQDDLSVPLHRRKSFRREIHAGLNVVENWNGAHGFIFFGKGGEIASNRLEDQELSVLALQLLQNCLVYVNTLMLQRILTEPAWLSAHDAGGSSRR